MADTPPLGSLVQVLATRETVSRGLAGRFGEVVKIGAPPSTPLAEIRGAGNPEEAVLVEFEDAPEGEWFGPNLLDVHGLQLDDTERIDDYRRVRVRIRATTLTESLGYAGLIGEVRGDTTPSLSGVNPVGGIDGQDFAVNVWLKELGEQRWFAASLVDPVDDHPKQDPSR